MQGADESDDRTWYLGTLPGKVNALLEAVARLERPEAAGPARAAIRKLAHGLKGSGGTYGLPRISMAAQAAELSPDAQLAAQTRRLVETLRRALDEGDRPRPRVLVADDDREAAEAIARALQRRGCAASIAASASEVSVQLASGQYALLVLDLVLPDADGRKLLARLRAAPRTAGLPVVVVAERRGPQLRAECAALGAEDWFEKPLDPDLLAAAALNRLAAGTGAREVRTDPLSGLGNRAALAEAWEQATRGGGGLCLAALGLDRLPRPEDALGQAGYAALVKRAGAVLTRTLRSPVTLARWGASDLAALLPGCDLPAATRQLEEAGRLLAQEKLAAPGGAPLTLSAGVAAFEGAATSLEDALLEAQRWLDQARRAGGAQVSSASEALGRRDRPRVLLADDDDEVARVVEHRLTRAGLEVVRHRDGRSALEAAPAAGAALFILDVNMPRLDGFSLLEQLRANPALAAVPVVMLTGLGRERDVVRGFELGADDYVVKPFSPAELMARVRRLLARDKRPTGVIPSPQAGSMAGTFASDQLLDFVQMLGIAAKTGQLTVRGDTRSGGIGFRDGRIVSAHNQRPGAQGGLSAVHEVLDTRSGMFEFVPGDPPAADLNVAVESVLLEAMRRRDEAGRGPA